jgi:hypothetical protein
MKKIKQEALDNIFPGDEKLAIDVLKEIKEITRGFDSLSELITQELPRDKGGKFYKKVAESHGVLITSIILPIYLKFPHLDRDKEIK